MLSGSLEAFGLEDLLRFLTAAAITGRLDVVRTRAAGTIVLDRGRVSGASRGEAPALDPEDALDAAADLFNGTGGAFVLSRLAEPPKAVIDLDVDAFLAEVSRRARAQAAADLLRELADAPADAPVAAGPSRGAPPIHLDRPPVRVLTREEQRMRLRL